MPIFPIFVGEKWLIAVQKYVNVSPDFQIM